MNGQMMTAKALLDRNANPTDADIRQALDPVLCRCGTYYRVIAAVRRAAELMRQV
jgi:nicotinate dehydrogenase subunit A